jgi:hypothetical protein
MQTEPYSVIKKQKVDAHTQMHPNFSSQAS